MPDPARKKSRVRGSPRHEAARIVIWIWTGAHDQTDPSELLDLADLCGHGGLAPVSGDDVLNAHHETVLDNPLDRRHAPCLHPTKRADAAPINTLRVEMALEGNAVWARHDAPDSPAVPQFKPFWPSPDPLCDGHAHMRWSPPGSLQLDVGVTARDLLSLHPVLLPADAAGIRVRRILKMLVEAGQGQAA